MKVHYPTITRDVSMSDLSSCKPEHVPVKTSHQVRPLNEYSLPVLSIGIWKAFHVPVSDSYHVVYDTNTRVRTDPHNGYFNITLARILDPDFNRFCEDSLSEFDNGSDMVESAHLGSIKNLRLEFPRPVFDVSKTYDVQYY